MNKKANPKALKRRRGRPRADSGYGQTPLLLLQTVHAGLWAFS